MSDFNRGKTIDRLVELLLRCFNRQAMPPLEDLARAHGVCVRTIQRDLAAIERRIPVPRWGGVGS